MLILQRIGVALRKESVDRKFLHDVSLNYKEVVALRKESVDRKTTLSVLLCLLKVALRKESVDRKIVLLAWGAGGAASLSARRAWIENVFLTLTVRNVPSRSPQGERG